jgi:hypothetical protein
MALTEARITELIAEIKEKASLIANIMANY